MSLLRDLVRGEILKSERENIRFSPETGGDSERGEGAQPGSAISSRMMQPTLCEAQEFIHSLSAELPLLSVFFWSQSFYAVPGLYRS